MSVQERGSPGSQGSPKHSQPCLVASYLCFLQDTRCHRDPQVSYSYKSYSQPAKGFGHADVLPAIKRVVGFFFFSKGWLSSV